MIERRLETGPRPEELKRLSLSLEEYHLIVDHLGRIPNTLELSMFGALWSEHCGYKNSKPLLQLLPSTSERTITKRGQENAGVVDLGDGIAVALKIESHNHPSAVEPYQGAATGVGGIIRDILAMGARPIALLDSLRFGPLDNPNNQRLFSGVVGGISWYGNCVGIPTIGGETQFLKPYSTNPLVNVMCVGLVGERIVRARAEGEGNLLMLVGADTGRDGILAASFASVTLDQESRENRPAVQIGDPFREKLLMEACLEVAKNNWLIGMQDLGAGGLTSAAVECASRAKTGVVVNVDKAPRRESGMTAEEVMLSESQERMLLIVKSGVGQKVTAIFEKWDLQASVVGVITDDSLIRVREGGDELAAIPVELLTSPPLYRREVIKPSHLSEVQEFEFESLPEVIDANKVLLDLLSSPNLRSKRSVWQQYDHQVLTNTVVGPGSDAAILRIKETRKAIAVSVDGNGRLCFLDPFVGGAIAVAEATRNVVCSGAKPVALTDCLNFGNPEKDGTYFQLAEAIKGMAEACKVLNIPIVSGNVSLYNETEESTIYPTPIVGAVGLLEDIDLRLDIGFRQEGDVVFILGSLFEQTVDTLAGSEYLEQSFGKVVGRPKIDLEKERLLQETTIELVSKKLLNSAHDVSDGGLAVALAESCVTGNIGVDASFLTRPARLDATLFGERQSRIIVSVSPNNERELSGILRGKDLPFEKIGKVGGKRIIVGNFLDVSLDQLKAAFEVGF